MDSSIVIVISISLAVIGLLFGMLISRSRGGSFPGASAEDQVRLTQQLSVLEEKKSELEQALAVDRERSSRLPTLEKEIEDITISLHVTRTAKSEVDQELAALKADSSRGEKELTEAKAKIRELELGVAEALLKHSALNDLKSEIDKALGETRTKLAERDAASDKLRKEYESSTLAVDLNRGKIAALETQLSTLQETLDQERKQNAEKLALLLEARETMTKEFRVLADEVMKSHGETFAKQNKLQIDQILDPVKVKLTEFQKGLQDAHLESAKERATLEEQIKNLTSVSAKMNEETTNLTRALKGKTQTQGAWGEMILATILERSGLREGEEYVTQQSESGEDGSRLRPDVVVNLPNDQRIIIDAKVSLTAFNNYVNAETDLERSAALKAHMSSLRSHVKALAKKEYHALSSSGLDYVIMFVPIEGALAAALQEDSALTSFAVENNVAIATPTTLMMALRTVANVWQVERRNRNAEEIAKRAGSLHDKFVGFLTDMGHVGTRLDNARASYHDAMNKLSLGKGNLVGQVVQLKDLGAKAYKTIPEAMLMDDDTTTSLRLVPSADI
jgi:DNA recombination protein RmuC